MTTAQITSAPATRKQESEQVTEWRYDQLCKAGYETRLAAHLAQRADIDLHVATKLLESGCPPELALRIL